MTVSSPPAGAAQREEHGKDREDHPHQYCAPPSEMLGDDADAVARQRRTQIGGAVEHAGDRGRTADNAEMDRHQIDQHDV